MQRPVHLSTGEIADEILAFLKLDLFPNYSTLMLAGSVGTTLRQTRCALTLLEGGGLVLASHAAADAHRVGEAGAVPHLFERWRAVSVEV